MTTITISERCKYVGNAVYNLGQIRTINIEGLDREEIEDISEVIEDEVNEGKTRGSVFTTGDNIYNWEVVEVEE